MYRPLLLLYSLIILLSSCNTVSVFQEPQTKTTRPVHLAGIGSGKDYVLQKDFNGTGLPTYKTPIKVSASKKLFTKQTYKAFTKSNTLQAAPLDIHYIDSLETKPTYVQIQIADKVDLIDALNQEENQEEKDYLSHNRAAEVVTSIYIALNEQDLAQITGADAVFLIQRRPKVYEFQLYKKGIETETMTLKKGVVFSYKTSHCCWQENNKRKLKIVDLVETYSSCPKRTYRVAEKARKKANNIKL